MRRRSETRKLLFTMTLGFADLHLHTVASDGTQTVADLVRRAKAGALRCIAVTDHDAISGDLTTRVATHHGIEVITGVEMKVDFDGISGELLGYFIDPANAALQAVLSRMERARIERMEKIVARCCENGIDIHMDEVRANAEGNIGRPHIARVLVAKGVLDDTDQAFRTLIGKGQPCFVPLEKVALAEAVRVLHGAGGVVSVAHPCLMHVEDWDRFLDRLADAGVNALETVYPYRDPNSPNLSIAPKLLAAKAAQRGFLVSGGSDDHGTDSTRPSLGLVRLPYEHVQALKEKAAPL